VAPGIYGTYAMADEYIIDGDKSCSKALGELIANLEPGTTVIIKKPKKVRSNSQRKSIELYCKQVAFALNDSGWDMKDTISHQLSIPWTQIQVKELQWRRIQEALGLDKSTTKISPGDVNKIFMIHNRWMQESFGMGLDFPSTESLIRSSYG